MSLVLRSPTSPADATPGSEPLAVLKGIGTLRRLIGIYPDGHPMVVGRLQELDDLVRAQLRRQSPIRIDVVHGEVHEDGASAPLELAASGQVVQDLLNLGVQSIHIHDGVAREELRALAQFLWDMKRSPSTDTVAAQLAARGVRHVRLGRLVPLDTRLQVQHWPDAPGGVIDPDYAESMSIAKDTFEAVAAGREIKSDTMRDFVQLIMLKVSRSNAVLSQVLAVKQYENLTWCHSVNVSMLCLLLGKQVGLDADMLTALTEAALLHDIGKTRVPVEIITKPGALDDHERRTIEAHTTFGAEILVQTDGLRPLTPLLALEHHRTVKGTGYPNLGDGVLPHPMSQLLSVCDIYEAVTGARSYRSPTSPERACLLLARLAGHTLNTSLVKTFVNTITFFPVGSLVRTSESQLGVVIRTTPGDPLHPVIVPVNDRLERDGNEIDTSRRMADGTYRCRIVESVPPTVETFDVREFVEARAA
jgi:putative nucleotidyltransferase with HDIG domain